MAAYCMTRAIDVLGVGLLDHHLRHCVAGAVAIGGDEEDRWIDEATAAVARVLPT